MVQGVLSMKDLTSSVYTFPDLIHGNFLYVDKTEYIWQLIRPAKGQYFLSRPRRFGKSLTVSTLEAIFRGQKELFKGLALYDKPYDWKQYPIIHLDLGTSDIKSPEQLVTFLLKKLEAIAESLNIALDCNQTPTAAFEDLVRAVGQREKIIILIDEYDKPILDNIANPLVNDILSILRGFYSVVKGTEALQRFVFMTGVSKFSHVSVFSNLNNLTDITMEADFATMLGYTQEELEYYFGDRIELLVEINQSSKEEMLRKIKLWYNGYRFEENSQTVYNPVSLVQFFRNNGKFNNYWFKTGTTRVLLELMKDSNADYVKTLTMPETSSFFDSFEISTLKPKTLLYQTGYLTIDKCVETPVPYSTETMTSYYLHFPNLEVEKSFNENLLEYYANFTGKTAQDAYVNLIRAVGEGNVDSFVKELNSIFINIPYAIRNDNEKYYQSICCAIFSMLRLYVQAEVCTNEGRIDLVVQAGDWIYVIEFKLNKKAELAIRQIHDKNYAEKYRESGKRLMLVGVNFSSKTGKIEDYVYEELKE